MAPRSLPLLALLLVAGASAFAQVPTAQAQAETLYARLGGPVKIAAFVSQTIDEFAASPRSNPTLEVADLDGAKQLLAGQICALAGGNCASSDARLHDVRAEHHIGNTEFRALIEKLRVAMRAQNVPLAARNELLELLAPKDRDLARL